MTWIEIGGHHYRAERIAFMREDPSYYLSLGEEDRGRFKPKPQPKSTSPRWEVGGIYAATDGLALSIDDASMQHFRPHLPDGFIELRERNQQAITIVNMGAIDAVTTGANGNGLFYDFWINLSGSRKKVLTLRLAEHPCDTLARTS